MKKSKQQKLKLKEKFLNERVSKVREDIKDSPDILITRLTGSIGYELELNEQSYSTSLQVSTENNLIACIMTRDILTAAIKYQALPTLTVKEKMPPKLLQHHLDARNLLDSICTGYASHVAIKAKAGKIKPAIIESITPKIITLNK